MNAFHPYHPSTPLLLTNPDQASAPAPSALPVPLKRPAHMPPALKQLYSLYRFWQKIAHNLFRENRLLKRQLHHLKQPSSRHHSQEDSR